MADNFAHPCGLCQVVSIDVLPDDVLLEIFDFYVVGYQDLDLDDVVYFSLAKRKIQSWQSLVHVCRRWRNIVFGSPRRLNLQLCCTPGRSAGMSLDIRPALPLHIEGSVSETSVNNIIAELKPSDRIYQINLACHHHTTSHFEKLLIAMQVPFPELALLLLSNETSSYLSDLPDTFLGGSAPRLRYLSLYCIPFPGLPKLLLSATHLVHLHLREIPPSSYISPEAMATCLSMLTSLESFQLVFGSYTYQEILRSSPPTRAVLPALTSFRFEGVNDYFDYLLSRIDAPQLDKLSTTLFDDIYFDTGTGISELNELISRTPTLGAYDEARLIFYDSEALVRLQSHPEPSDHRMVEVKVLFQLSDWLLFSLTEICTLSLDLVLTMENLYIHENLFSSPDWKETPENTQWLDLLLPFTAVKNLYLSKLFATLIAPALQELNGARSTEVLPALQNVLLEGFQPSGPVQKGIAQFVSARQLTNHPIAVSRWDRYIDLTWEM